MKKKKNKNSGLKSLVISLIIVIVLFTLITLRIQITKAQTNVSLIGQAQVLNTGEYLFFSSNNANATVNNNTQEFSGYAWSNDAGWVAFGTADNPDGPVIFSTSDGAVSGKATIINTGNSLDFNSAPYSSNVVISSSGSFSGYAWSEDLGWIDFKGVSGPGISFGLPEAGAIIEKINSNLIFYFFLLISFITGLIIFIILVNRIIKR